MTKIVESPQRTTITFTQTSSSKAQVSLPSNATDSIGSAQTNQGNTNNIQELTFLQKWGRFLYSFLTDAPLNLGRFLYSLGTNTSLTQETRNTATACASNNTVASSTTSQDTTILSHQANAETNPTNNTEFFISPQVDSGNHPSSTTDLERLLTAKSAAHPPITPKVLKFEEVTVSTASSSDVEPSAPQTSNACSLLESIRKEFFKKDKRPDAASVPSQAELLIQEIILQMVHIKAQTTSLTEDLIIQAIHAFKKASLKRERSKHIPFCVKTALSDTNITTQQQALNVLELLKNKSSQFAKWLSTSQEQASATTTMNS